MVPDLQLAGWELQRGQRAPPQEAPSCWLMPPSSMRSPGEHGRAGLCKAEQPDAHLSADSLHLLHQQSNTSKKSPLKSTLRFPRMPGMGESLAHGFPSPLAARPPLVPPSPAAREELQHPGGVGVPRSSPGLGHGRRLPAASRGREASTWQPLGSAPPADRNRSC